MSEEEGGSSGSSTPEPPEPMDVEEETSQEGQAAGEGLKEAVRESVPAQGNEEEEEEEWDVKQTAKEFAEFLVVDSKQDKQVLDDRIESVVFRVEEFKSQLERMHQSMTSTFGEMEELHKQIPLLKELFARIEQVEEFVHLMTQNVDSLEEAVSRAEKEMDPSKIRKVFTSLPKLGKGKKGRGDSSGRWQAPQLLQAKDYFSSPT